MTEAAEAESPWKSLAEKHATGDKPALLLEELNWRMVQDFEGKSHSITSEIWRLRSLLANAVGRLGTSECNENLDAIFDNAESIQSLCKTMRLYAHFTKSADAVAKLKVEPKLTCGVEALIEHVERIKAARGPLAQKFSMTVSPEFLIKMKHYEDTSPAIKALNKDNRFLGIEFVVAPKQNDPFVVVFDY